MAWVQTLSKNLEATLHFKVPERRHEASFIPRTNTH